jgi:GT2 family glycosyltransferase
MLFSVVIPTYNRPHRLQACLQSLSQLDYPRDRFEVIVVDDGSAVDLVPVVEPFQALLNLTLLRQRNAGPANARNTGAAIAKGEFLVFTDDDCLPVANWLTLFADRLQAMPEALVGGHTLNALPENFYSTASQLLIDYLYEYYNANGDRANFFASNNFALSRQIFEEIGGFDVTFPLAAGEDRELCDRWLHQGNRMVYAPDAKIYHAHHLTLRSFWKQHFNYGRGAFYFHQLRAQRGQQQIKVEPLTFYFRLLTYPFKRSNWLLAIPLTALLFISQVANVTGFGWQRKQEIAPKTSVPIREYCK